MDWRLLPERELDGTASMAADEVAAETVAAGGPATLRVYRWVPGTLSLGYGNDADVVDRAFCEDAGLTVTRRPTGGGAIYHDPVGDVAYSIIAPAEEFPGDVTESYRALLEPILDAFDRFGVDVEFARTDRAAVWSPACYLRELDPAHDLVGPDGRKIAGNAQYRTRDAIVQHGSLSFEMEAAAHLNCFADPPVSVESFKSNVCGAIEFVDTDNVENEAGLAAGEDLQRSRFVSGLENALREWADAEEGTWTEAETERAAEIADGKYRADAWVEDRIDPLE
ncbi:lipase [Halobacteriales archaeon SW_12_69_24]|nr:MAG: lipase [Halobacteriales archaeon SW_12_69_24]